MRGAHAEARTHAHGGLPGRRAEPGRPGQAEPAGEKASLGSAFWGRPQLILPISSWTLLFASPRRLQHAQKQQLEACKASVPQPHPSDWIGWKNTLSYSDCERDPSLLRH